MTVVTAAAPAWWLAGISLGAAVAVGVGAAATSAVPLVAGFVGGAGVALLAGALAIGRPGVVGWATGCLVASWVVATGDAGDTLRPDAALAAAGCLIAAETAYWSLEPRMRRPGARVAVATTGRRAADLVALAIASVAIGVGVLALAAGVDGGGLPAEALGVAAVLAMLALIVALASRTATSRLIR